MNKSPLKVLALELDSDTYSISPHIRYIDSENTLADMYKIIGCDLVTCTGIQINGQYFDVWSDDEALLKDNSFPSLYVNDDLVIFGNIIFSKCDDEGKTIGLDNGELQILYRFVKNQFSKLLHWLNNLKQ